MPKLNYRVFEVTVVLSSYENRLINFYDAPTHYAWLLDRAVNRDLIICGNNGLCFKNEIVLPNGVNGTLVYLLLFCSGFCQKQTNSPIFVTALFLFFFAFF